MCTPLCLSKGSSKNLQCSVQSFLYSWERKPKCLINSADVEHADPTVFTSFLLSSSGSACLSFFSCLVVIFFFSLCYFFCWCYLLVFVLPSSCRGVIFFLSWCSSSCLDVIFFLLWCYLLLVSMLSSSCPDCYLLLF